jgi:hypothetical protein
MLISTIAVVALGGIAVGCTANVTDPKLNQSAGDTECTKSCDDTQTTCVAKCSDDSCRASCTTSHQQCVTQCGSSSTDAG